MSTSTYLTLLLGVSAILLIALVGWFNAEQRHRRRNRDLLTELRAQQIAAATTEQKLLEMQANYDATVRKLYLAKADAADATTRSEQAQSELNRLRRRLPTS